MCKSVSTPVRIVYADEVIMSGDNPSDRTALVLQKYQTSCKTIQRKAQKGRTKSKHDQSIAKILSGEDQEMITTSTANWIRNINMSSKNSHKEILNTFFIDVFLGQRTCGDRLAKSCAIVQHHWTKVYFKFSTKPQALLWPNLQRTCRKKPASKIRMQRAQSESAATRLTFTCVSTQVSIHDRKKGQRKWL